MADTYYRMEDFNKAEEWLKGLQESFPEFEKQKVRDFLRVIKSRKERIEAAKANPPDEKNKNKGEDAAEDIGFKGFQTGFEPEEKQNMGRAERFRLDDPFPMLGFVGPRVGLMKSMGAIGNFEYLKRLRNMMSEGTYWVEFWYRTQMGSAAIPGVAPIVTLQLVGQGDKSDAATGTQSFMLERTYGQWRKIGAKMKAPVSQDGLLRITFGSVMGTVLLDGIKILPVSDRENDSLRGFVEGSETQ